jgi:pentatricopeptide repeat protein
MRAELSKGAFQNASRLYSSTVNGLISKQKQRSSSVKERKKRFFDPHTVSIWAQNMARRNGATKEALGLILNRMESRRAGHTTALYNSALDICGHGGRLLDSARIMHQMIAKNVRPNERTITSILNAIAEYTRNLPLEYRAENSTKGIPEEKEDFPGLKVFKVKSKTEAVQLGIKLYASWLENSKPSLYPFNALLKILWRGEGGQLLLSLFPLEKGGVNYDYDHDHDHDRDHGYGGGEVMKRDSLPAWMPMNLDIVTFSTAILACQSHSEPFQMAMEYWRAFRETGIECDAGILHSLLVVIDRELSNLPSRMPLEKLELRRKVLRNVQGLLIEMKGAISPPVETTNTFMDLSFQLGCYELGISYWQDSLLPILEESQSFAKSKRFVNDRTVALLFEQMIKVGRAQDSIDLSSTLHKRYGMHITAEILNSLLTACRRIGDRELAERLFQRHVQAIGTTITPNVETIYQLLLVIAEDTHLDKNMIRNKGQTIIRYLEREHSQVMENARHRGRLVHLFNRFQ